MSVRIGLYQDLRDPPPWGRGWGKVAGAALEHIEEAERLGLDSVWSTEHHFFEDGYMPQPLTWLAAVAARTSRIGLATGIVIATLHHPLEIAEQAALVDQLSDGRVQLGLGTGYVTREFDAFGIDRGRRWELIEETTNEVRRLLDGVVTPPPVQDRLPIWLGGFGPRGARIAGRTGSGLLWLNPELLEPYRQGLREGGHDPESAVLGGLATLIVSRDPDRAWAMLEPHLQYQWQSYEHAAMAGSEEAGALMFDEAAKIERSAGPTMLPPAYDTVTPEEAVRRMKEWLGGQPVSDIFFWDTVAGMPDELAEEHVELLAREVAPHLREL